MAQGKKMQDRKPGSSDVHKRQKKKNLALALAIVGFCVLVYIVSIIKMSGG